MQILQGFDSEVITFAFVDDEDQERHILKRRIHSQYVKDQFKIDFTDLLDQEWDGLQAETPFFSTKHQIEKLKSSYEIQNNAASFHIETQQSKLITKKRRRTEKPPLKEVFTIFDNPIPLEDVDQFLESGCFQNCLRFLVILNLIGLLLTDYSFRLQKDSKYLPLSTFNKVSLHFQLYANCAFSLEIIFKLMSRKAFFKNPWNSINLIGTLACWSSIFVNLVEQDGNPWFQLLNVLKIIRGIRVIEVFQFIRNPFQVFITTIPDLGKIFFPLLIFILFYSTLGLILFDGANEHKCRETPKPIDDKWPQVSPELCGATEFKCEEGYCGNPYDYGLALNETEMNQYQNEYGLVGYNNIGKAILTTYHYVFLSNWTAIKYKFSHYISPYIASLYFFTLAVFLFFILANLNMITLCKSYIEKEKLREKTSGGKKDPNEEVKDQNQINKISQYKLFILEVLRKVQVILIVVQTVILVLDYEGMSNSLKSRQAFGEFILSWIAFIILIVRTIILNKLILYDNFAIFDWIIVGISIGEIIESLASGKSVNDTPEKINLIFRSVKILRIIKILYFSDEWFCYEKTILKIFIQTVKTIKYFFVLLFCVVLVVSFIGENLFAFKVRFIHGTHILDIENGVPYVSNFESVYKSIVSVIFILENERWTETMYNYYHAVGWPALIFFNIVAFVLHLMLTRLFIAIFLCYFRRNLEKRNSLEQQKDLLSKSLGSKLKNCSKEDQEGQVDEITDSIEIEFDHKETNSIPSQFKEPAPPSKLFWFFNRNACVFQVFRAFFISTIFNYIIFFAIGVHCLTIVVRTSDDSSEKTQILEYIEIFPLTIYIIEVLLGVLGFGFYFEDRSYLKRSKMHFLNFIVIIIIIISKTSNIDQLISKVLGRLVIIKIFTLFNRASKQTSISLKAISAIAQRFIRIYCVYLFLLLIPAILPLKLLKNGFYYCQNAYSFSDSLPTNAQDCMLAGGDWLKQTQSFQNIFTSIALMYQIVTSESWTHFIERSYDGEPWDLYFVMVFFAYNTCLLNIFVGLTVQTYLTLKDEAYKLNLLRPNQRGWILIKNSINDLVPIPSMREPENAWIFRRISYWIVSKRIYGNFIDILPYLNGFVYMLRFYRAQNSYLADLYKINTVFVIIFAIDTVLKLQLYSDYLYIDNSRVQLMGLLFYVGYGIATLFTNMSDETFQILQFFGAMLLILRCKKLIFRFTRSKTLVNSVLDVLPKCVRIGGILATFLFFYAAVGMELFKYTKYHPKANGFTTGFANFFTATMTLLKVVSNESWFQQVSAFIRGSTSADVCFPINTYEDAIKHPHMGCGSPIAYLYFLSFHVLMALLILNVLIATMTSAYDENYEKQYKSVNIFQLQDCLELWQKYDPNGTGVIPYKKFWRLSSEIAILFGISKKKLIKRKQKFLEELDIQICQSINPQETSVFCYKFHDVLTKFSKIKLQVSSRETLDENGEWIDFEIHPMIQRQIEDYITKVPTELYENYRPYKNFKSGEMKYFFGLLRKLRAWRLSAKTKNVQATSKLSHIIRSAIEKKYRKQLQMNVMKRSIVGTLESKKKQ